MQFKGWPLAGSGRVALIMATSYTVWCCSQHGLVKSTSGDFKCKRLDCVLTRRGVLQFQGDGSDEWKFHGDAAGDEVDQVDRLIDTVREPLSREHYRAQLRGASSDRIMKFKEMLTQNIHNGAIGPVFASEILAFAASCGD